MHTATKLFIVGLSELLAFWLIWRLWRSDDALFFKLALSAIALIPVIGPVVALWLGNFPPVASPAMQDRLRYGTDVLDRWRGVFEAKEPRMRFRRWRELMDRHERRQDSGDGGTS